LGAALKASRVRQQLTQEELAERSGLSYKFIGEIERGRGNPTVETLARLAEALGVGIATLFVETGPQQLAENYEISKRDLQVMREALQSIDDITKAVSDRSYRSKRRRSR
jgi:transcriptional regulator with XRE-family HTH domain